MEINKYQALEGFVDLLMDAICVVDTEGRYVYVSAAFERIFGYTPQELIGSPMLNLVHPDDRERTLQAAGEIMNGQPKQHFENRYLHKQGHVVHVMWSARWSPVDRLRIAVARDITELKRGATLRLTLLEISEAANTCEDLPCLFRRTHQLLSGLLPAHHLCVVLYERGQPSLVWHADDPQDGHVVRSLAAEVVRTGQPLVPSLIAGAPAWTGVPLHASGGIIGVLMVKRLDNNLHSVGQDREVLQFVSSQVAAAVERKQLHELLQSMARHDQLTGLANRMLLQERLQAAVDHARRHGDRLAVLYLDLNKFKQVNDSLGHAAGDTLLQEVARRLKACVRSSDTVARIGGDEFVVLLERIGKDADALRVAKAIQRALQVPVKLEGQDWTISSSIGIARYPEDATDLAQLFRHADQAMYRAKKQGGDCLHD